VKAADVDDEKRAAVDIIVALDVSGSMSGRKIEDCKITLQLMVRSLTSLDHFGLITYSQRAQVTFPACKMTTENKERAFQVIEMIRAGGGTNLSAGLSLAAQEMSMITNPNAIQRIFLLTDGHANVGITDTGSLQAMVRSFVSDFDCMASRFMK
jgi:Ca-activated chloride channel family protein